MSDNIVCKMCKAEFREGALNDKGKCTMCEKLWPGVANKDELKKPDDEKENEGRLKNVVNKQIEEALLGYGLLTKCECGAYFYRRSPAQKTCTKCKDEASL